MISCCNSSFNGADKTTTINMLCTLLRPTSGRAAINGHGVATQPHAVRHSIGVIVQDPALDERLTAYENLKFHAMLYDVPPHVFDVFERRTRECTSGRQRPPRALRKDHRPGAPHRPC